MRIKQVLFLLFVSITFVYSQGWNSAVTTSFGVSNSDKISSYVDRDGIHVLVNNNGTLKYALLNSSGSIIRSNSSLETGVQYSFATAVITGYESKVYAVFQMDDTIRIYRSSNAGVSWENNAIMRYGVGTSNINGIDAVVDSRGIHVVWAKLVSSDYETYYNRYVINSSWQTEKNVSDQGTGAYGGTPSVAVSDDKVHVSYHGEYSLAYTRDYNFSTPEWEDTQDLPEYEGYTTFSSSRVNIIADANYLYSFQAVSYNTCSECWIDLGIAFSKRSINGTSWSTPSLIATTLTDWYTGSPKKTLDGKIHIIYPIVNYEIGYRNYDGTNWSSETLFSGYGENFTNGLSLFTAGNDIFTTWIKAGTSYLKYRQYDAVPQIPANTAIGASNQVTVSWSYNPEPDIQHVEVWRKCYLNDFNQEDWTLKVTRTTNSWTDNDFQLSGLGDEYTVYYKFRAKDNEDQLSDYSSQISTVAVMVFWKNGNQISQKIPREFNLEQNYPNPFNPSTTIDYAIPEVGNVTITVFDHLGREVASVVNKEQNAGYYSATFDASKLSSGTYFYKVSVGKYSATKKMLLLK